MKIVESAGITDIGLKRKNNEDDLFIDDELGLYLVSDGMGGHRAGEVASAMVVAFVSFYMKEYRGGKRSIRPEHYDDTLSREGNWLKSSFNFANLGVFRASAKKEACRGMGATVAAVYFTEKTFIAANVGDSLIYRIQDNTIELLSVVHTVQAELNRRESVGGRNTRHILTRCMGVRKRVTPDICEWPFLSGDIVVICSDGLSEKVHPDEICKVIVENPVDIACRRLVDMANTRGGDDNITVIAIRVGEKATGVGFWADALSRAGNFIRTVFNMRQLRRFRKQIG